MEARSPSPERQVAWKPQPGPQTLFVSCPVGDLFFGGARGGGKSAGLIGDAAIRAGRYGAAFNGLFLRRTLTELVDIKQEMHGIYPKFGAVWAESRNEWKFPQGGILHLAYLEDDNDADKYQGRNLSWIGIDEVGNFPSPVPVDKLWGALRSAHGIPCVRRLTGNPGGSGHAWLYKRYIKDHTPGEVFRWKPQPDLAPDFEIESVFIPSTLENNLILRQQDPDYEKRIAAVGDPALFRAWRHGDWLALAGGYFSTWNPEKHTFHPTSIPYWWDHWISVDWGYSHDSAVLWYAFDGQRVYVYREMCRSGLDPTRLALEIIAATDRDIKPSAIYMSHDAFARRTSERSIALDIDDVFVAHDFPRCIEAEKDRVNGWQEVQRRLSDGTLVVSTGCRKLTESIPTMMRDPKKPEDILKVDGDDVCDSLRYGLASRRELSPDLPDELRLAAQITATEPNARYMQTRHALAKEKERASFVPRHTGRRWANA